MANNYNMSDSGINVSVSCYYDTFLAQDYFNMLLVPTDKKDKYRQTVYKLDYMKDNAPYRIIGIRGYSQGDYLSVMIPARMSDYSDYIKHIEKVIYDSPLYIHIQINNEEYYSYDLLDDEYIAMTDELKEDIIKTILSNTRETNKGYIKEQLNVLIPLEPEYRY